MNDTNQTDKKRFRHIRNILAVTIDEYKRLLKDFGVLLILVIAALIYPLLYGTIYLNETIHDMPIAVVDHSNSVHSRTLIRNLDATPDLKVTHTFSNMEEVKDAFYKRKIHGVVYIPADYSLKINKMEQAIVSTYADMSSFLYYRTLALGSNFAVLEMGDNVKLERLNDKGIVGREAEVAAEPFTYEAIILYNEPMGYASFLLPAILMLVIHQTLLFGIGMSAGTAREENTFHELTPLNSDRSVFHVVIGKALCYFSWYLVVAAYILGVIPKLFNLPHIGNPLDIALMVVPYLLAVIFFSMTLSVFIRNRETGFVVFLFTSLILLFLSGSSWPLSSVHSFWRTFSMMLPSTFGINGYIKINSMGATISQINMEYIGLWIQAGFYFITTLVVYRWEIVNSRKRLADLVI
ncbi:MAG: ABC transporter permease [Dysgonamonadaceae bacterium]|jgi:ABC-2 type transport system permease protein|nr:ABC transporter permease [Dysgonamonadaceae bacterium]MDD4247138.1 ABC transporter permease [Dysgonamonadaceae bacterium]MDD4605890.1 ABC transporter permease [Dysgonamonadaceae bacterium]HUI32229.1 ABC transporter permease [Dysgonamonadaceae bacterium]